MKHLLDTNTCIRFINGRSEGIRRRLLATRSEEVCLCSVVVAELYFGAAKSRYPEATLANQKRFASRFASLPFDDACAETYAGIRADLERKGIPMGANDLIIASIALKHGLMLVTNNTGEFGRVAGLAIEDWS